MKHTAVTRAANPLSLVACFANWVGMMSRATNLMIGTLALALIAGAFGARLGYQKFAGIKQQVPFRVVFEGSASGVRRGSSVNFAGVRIGEVASLKLDHHAA